MGYVVPVEDPCLSTDEGHHTDHRLASRHLEEPFWQVEYSFLRSSFVDVG